jgi:DNA polymerase III sliding clamp (beta) subunit (PCNA family)
MIKIKTNIKKFINILKILESLNDDVIFNFQKDKLFIRISDRSNVTLLILNIDKSFFDEYKIKENVYCIDISNFIKIVRKVGKKEVSIDLDSDFIILKNEKDEFKMNYYSIPADERSIPNPDYSNIWNVESSEFFSSVEDLLEFFQIGCFSSKDNLTISVKSHGVEGKTLIESKKEKSKDCSCYYDLSYINILSGIKELYNNIIFKFGEDVPCCIEGKSDEVNLVWFLAERVNDENE